MDIEQFIKVQEHTPISSTDQQLKQHYYFSHFYADDSQQHSNQKGPNIKIQSSFIHNQDIISIFQKKLYDYSIDIRTTHISQIINFAESNFNSEISDWDSLRKAIIKRKRNLKRLHAKGRMFLPKLEKEIVVPVEMSGNIQNQELNQNQIKKKRNRMSAQISRDKKKEHIKDLEKNFKMLKEQTEQTKAQNQKLKEQLKRFNQVQSQSSKNNKFISLLMLLGIIFLISIVKDLFKPNNYQSLNLSLVGSQKDTLLSPQDQSELVGKGKKLLSEMKDIQEQEGDLANQSSVKNAVLLKLDQIQQKPYAVPFPKKLFNKIKNIREQLF